MESVNSCWHWNLNNNWYGQESLPSDFNIGNFLRKEKLLAAARKLDQSSSSSSSPNKSPISRSSKTLNRTSPIDSFVKFDYWSLDLEYLIWFDSFLYKETFRSFFSNNLPLYLKLSSSNHMVILGRFTNYWFHPSRLLSTTSTRFYTIIRMVYH